METRVAVRPVEVVEDEPGKGFFLTTIEEGEDNVQGARIPALHIKGGYEAEQAYIQKQLETGIPVVAYRSGKRGQCTVAVNQDVIAVDAARKFDTQNFDTPFYPKNFEWTDLGAETYYSQHLVDSYGQGENTPKLEFTGTNNQTGLPIKITVGFVRP